MVVAESGFGVFAGHLDAGKGMKGVRYIRSECEVDPVSEC